MRRLLAGVLLALTVAACGTTTAPAGPADAATPARVESGASARPRMQYATTLSYQHQVLEVRLRVKGNPFAIRNMAAVYSNALPGVNISSGPCIPTAICLHVVADNYGPTRQYGYWSRNDDGTVHTIRLNTYYRHARDGQAALRPRNVSCHELGHVLGLLHHRSAGCMKLGSIAALRPSRAEIAVLNRAYTW